LAVAAAICSGAGVSAHRLDEYLQAARLDLRPEGVVVALELTPGAAVAPSILARIDTDADNHLSAAEQHAYLNDVAASLQVVVDGTPMALQLDATDFPTVDALRRGEGTIRLQARGSHGIFTGGWHHLSFANRHAPRESVYMANALVPDTPGVVIERQQHSPDQRQFSLDYSVERPSTAARTSCLAMATLVAAVLLVRITRSRAA